MQDLTVVIPIFNEEENIQPLIGRLAQALAEWPGTAEFLFVDDGSTDTSLEKLKQAQNSDPRIRIAHLRKNRGQTAAMAAGFRLAQGRAVVTLDGDLQNDPEDIPRLVAMLDEWDVVCGIRADRHDGRWKKFSSRIANRFSNWITGDVIVDTGCTLKAYRRRCLEGLELYSGMHRFLPTLLMMRGYKLAQVPVRHHPRVAGKTKYGTWGRLTKGLGDLWAVRWMKKNRIEFESALELIESRKTAEASTSVREKARV